ncbi:MAG: nitroreductase family protein [Actinomycetota bacterium]
MDVSPGTDRYVEIVDHALTTTRAVRMRLDLERHVDDQVLLDCIDVAEQAPTGGNMGSRRWMIVRDPSTKDRLAELYLAAGGSWVIETADRLEGTDHPNARMMQGAKRLAESISSMPALVIPTIIGRHDGSGRPGLFDSVIQSAWSFMVALRSRGLGTVWTTMYLGQSDQVATLLELPDDVTQICLFPVAYTKGVDFSPSTRRLPARDITYFDRFGQTRPSAEDSSLVDVVAETDVKATPEAVDTAIADSPLADLRVGIEQIPGGSRIRVHAAGGDEPSGRRAELERQLAEVVGALPGRD